MSSRTLRIYCDGASQPNPGPAGYGVYAVEERSGREVEVARLSVPIGKQTNNYAEYQAVIAGLRYAIDHDYENIEIFTDSRLVVNHVTGEWEAKHTSLKPLYQTVRSLLKRFMTWSITWIPRKENRTADALSKAAVTGR